MCPVQDKVDWDLFEVEIEEEEAAAKEKKMEAFGNVSIKDGKMLAASSSPSLCYFGEDGRRE